MQSVAVHTAFLYEGASRELIMNSGEWCNGGFIGLAIDCVAYAKRISAHLRPYSRDPETEWPGVFEYEVTEELGKWLAQNRSGRLEPLDTDREFVAELHRLTKEFFAQ